MGWIKRIGRSVTSPVRSVGRSIDPAASRSLVGRGLAAASGVPGLSSALTVVTGGAAALNPAVRANAMREFATGAAAGSAIAAGGLAGGAPAAPGGGGASASFVPSEGAPMLLGDAIAGRIPTDRSAPTSRSSSASSGGDAAPAPGPAPGGERPAAAPSSAAGLDLAALARSPLVIVGGVLVVLVLLAGLFRRR